MDLVNTRKIRSCVFPFGANAVENLRFWWEHLRDFGLSCEQTRRQARDDGYIDAMPATSPTERILRRVGYETRRSNGYVNLCSGQKVFAQLHPRRSGDGVDLALRECSGDDNLPKCELLRKIGVQELAGYKRTNKDWLEGRRHTDSGAEAFYIPCGPTDDLCDAEWKEFEDLLKYAKEKMDRKEEKKSEQRRKRDYL